MSKTNKQKKKNWRVLRPQPLLTNTLACLTQIPTPLRGSGHVSLRAVLSSTQLQSGFFPSPACKTTMTTNGFLVGLFQAFPIFTFLGPSAEFDLLTPPCCWNTLFWHLWFPILHLLGCLCSCLTASFQAPLQVPFLSPFLTCWCSSRFYLGPLFSPLLASSHSIISFSWLYDSEKSKQKWNHLTVYHAKVLNTPQLWHIHRSLLLNFPKGSDIAQLWVPSALSPGLHFTAKRLC